MKHIFVINPAAGKGRTVEIIKPQIEKYCKNHDVKCEMYITKKPYEAIEYVRTRAAEGDAVRFYACGGDGTLYEVVNGAYGYDNAEVAVIPLGSGNDFVRLFGSKEQFINIPAQIEGTPILLDVIKCGKHIAINQCSMGLDAEICAKQSYFKKIPFLNGEAAYIAALLYCFFRKLNSKFTIKIDKEEAFTRTVLFCVGANSRWYGGGFMPAPLAMPDDGLLDFIIVKKNMNRIKLLGLINEYKAGQHLSWENTTFVRGKKIHIKSETPAAVNIDGETEYINECTFEIIEKGIRFVVPSTSTYFEDV